VRILVAEDNFANRLFLTRLLEKLGYAVMGVEDGKQAVAELRKEHYDLLLADVRMPVMDGVTLTCIIRDSLHPEIDPDMPIVAVTAHAMRGDRERFLAAGANWYLPKPVNTDELLDVIGCIEKAKKLPERSKLLRQKAS
jgi:CheY-like chemotaxis protein